MSPSIKQIASLAGVSRGTVDRALNDRPGIRADVRRRILQIAAESGYRSNRAGKMLGICKKPLCIGVQMPSVGNEFFADVKAGLDQAAAELADFGLSLAVKTMKGFSGQTQVRQIEELLAQSIHALAFVPVDSPEVVSLLDHLAGQNLPVMTFNTDLPGSPRLGHVGNDYTASGAIAAGLLGLIADERPLGTLVMTGSSRMPGHMQRVEGFCGTLARLYPQVRILETWENQDDEDLSGRLMETALRRWPGLDAVFLAAGGVAGACRILAARRERQPVGKSVKVICFDQTAATQKWQRAGLITASIGQEPFRQGYLPVKYLFEYLLDGTLPPACTLTRNTIVIREHLDVREQPAPTKPERKSHL